MFQNNVHKSRYSLNRVKPNINIKMDEDALKQVPKFKEAKVMFNNKMQLLCSNNLSLETKKKLIKVVFGVLLFMVQKHGTYKK
jgi:hypothetical protein